MVMSAWAEGGLEKAKRSLGVLVSSQYARKVVLKALHGTLTKYSQQSLISFNTIQYDISLAALSPNS